MASLKVYDEAGEVVEEIEIDLDESLAKRGKDILAQALLRQAANARKPYAHTKSRSEVRGGGAKPWRQKGTGRARHGSRRSPIWVGGGITFGPTSERNFTKGMNKKERRLAMRKALYHAITDGKIALLTELDFGEPSTKRGVTMLKNIGLDGKTLIVHASDEMAVRRSFTNLKKVTQYDSSRLNIFDLMMFDNVLCIKAEFDKIRERWID